MLSRSTSDLLHLAHNTLTVAFTDGRRPIYLSSLPLLCIGSLAVGLARSIPELMVARVLQGLGSSVGLSVGAAVIGDIYKLDERGTAMGVFFGVGQFFVLCCVRSIHHSPYRQFFWVQL